MNRRRVIIGAVVVLAVGVALYFYAFSKLELSSLKTQEKGIAVRLYYYDPSKDQGLGGVECSTNGLVTVARVVPESEATLTGVINLLLRGEISEEESALGITSEFPLSGVSLIDASIQDGIAILRFSDPEQRTSGGSCRVAILWAQIEATAKQFPIVKTVQYSPEELFQP